MRKLISHLGSALCDIQLHVGILYINSIPYLLMYSPPSSASCRALRVCLCIANALSGAVCGHPRDRRPRQQHLCGCACVWSGCWALLLERKSERRDLKSNLAVRILSRERACVCVIIACAPSKFMQNREHYVSRTRARSLHINILQIVRQIYARKDGHCN